MYIFYNTESEGVFPDVWKMQKLQPHCKKDALGNYRPGCLTSVSGEIINQVLLKATSGHMEMMMISNTQNRSNTSKLCFSNLPCLLG